jgi:hypothetical protein
LTADAATEPPSWQPRSSTARRSGPNPEIFGFWGFDRGRGGVDRRSPGDRRGWRPGRHQVRARQRWGQADPIIAASGLGGMADFASPPNVRFRSLFQGDKDDETTESTNLWRTSHRQHHLRRAGDAVSARGLNRFPRLDRPDFWSSFTEATVGVFGSVGAITSVLGGESLAGDLSDIVGKMRAVSA